MGFGYAGESDWRNGKRKVSNGKRTFTIVVWNINGHGDPAGNYDGYMYDFLVCNYRPSKLPMHANDVGRDYKDQSPSILK